MLKLPDVDRAFRIVTMMLVTLKLLMFYYNYKMCLRFGMQLLTQAANYHLHKGITLYMYTTAERETLEIVFSL